MSQIVWLVNLKCSSWKRFDNSNKLIVQLNLPMKNKKKFERKQHFEFGNKLLPWMFGFGMENEKFLLLWILMHTPLKKVSR